jgi:hypothetical protein
MHKKRYEGAHGRDEGKVVALQFERCLKGSRGHERVVDIYLPSGIVLIKLCLSKHVLCYLRVGLQFRWQAATTHGRVGMCRTG